MLIDMVMVGMINFYALAAVGISMQFMMILNAIMTVYVMGGNALISRYIGQKRKNRASSLTFSLILFAVITSIFISIFGYYASENIYKLMGAQEEVVHLGALYFKIISLGLFIIFMDTLLYNFLSAAGDTKSSFYIKLVSSFINAFLNYILIFGHFGFSAMGIEGAAYATLIAYTFNVIVYLYVLNKTDSKLNIIFKIRVSDLKKAWKIGWSAGLDRLISSLSFLVFVSIITAYGSAELAGYQVGLRIEGIAFMPGFGFAIAGMALVGQNLGAKDFNRAYKMGVISARVASVFMGAIGVVLILFPEFLVRIFTNDKATILVASQYLILVGLAQIPLAINFVYSAALRVAGATKLTLKVSVLSLWFLRVLPSFIAYKFGLGIISIFIIMNMETLIKGIIFSYFYNKKEWLKIKI